MIYPNVCEEIDSFKLRLLWSVKSYNFSEDVGLSDERINEIYNEGVALLQNKQPGNGELEDLFIGFKKDNLKGAGKIANHFLNMITIAFKGGAMKDALLWEKKNKNIAVFSALKSAVMTQEILKNRNLDDKEYLEIAKKKYNTFNGTFLNAEQDISFVNGRMAKSFKKFIDQKNTHPLLKYCTQLDNKVRPAHADLEGIIREVDDSFWDTYTPPQGYNCRCFLRNLKDGIVTDKYTLKHASFLQEQKEKLAIKNKEMDFKNNPFKTNFVFKPSGKGKHQYFTIANSDIVKEIIKNMI